MNSASRKFALSLFLYGFLIPVLVHGAIIRAGSNHKRVINGTEAELGQFPYLVGIRQNFGPPLGYQVMCTGVLITTECILTAAHCFADQETGEVDSANNFDALLETVTKEDTKHVVTFKEIRVHELYNIKEQYNDISVVILNELVKLNENVKTIALANEGSRFIGENTISVGWGLTAYDGEFGESVHYMESQVTYRIDCYIYGNILKDKQICVAEEGDSCVFKGDSGGPLVINGPAGDISIGVLSFGDEICRQNPEVYTSVSGYHDWIKKNAVGEIEFANF